VRVHENVHLEIKREWTADLKKEVVAFANTQGGTIHVGLDDQGRVIGVEDAQQVLLQITNMIRDAIRPDVTLFTDTAVEKREGKQIISITVQRGANRPYYIAEKGLKPSGVYVRQGSSSAPASESAIRRMIQETDGDQYENIRSLEQELTFADAAAEFQKRGLELGETQMKSLGLTSLEGLYTNLGRLLSDRCVHTVKAAVFSGTDKGVFSDRKEFAGSLLRQLTDTYTYLDLYNRTKATFSGLERQDYRDYPPDAIREALLNAIVHREYSFSGSTLINIYDDRMEFVSIGGLVAGLTMDDIMLGVSQARNERLAAVFYRLKLIEAYGTGIQKIFASFKEKENHLTPRLACSENAFLAVLPNRNYRPPASSLAPTAILPQEDRIMDYIAEHGSISRTEAQILLKIGQTMAGRNLRRMEANGLLQVYGKGRNTRYQRPR